MLLFGGHTVLAQVRSDPAGRNTIVNVLAAWGRPTSALPLALLTRPLTLVIRMPNPTHDEKADQSDHESAQVHVVLRGRYPRILAWCRSKGLGTICIDRPRGDRPEKGYRRKMFRCWARLNILCLARAPRSAI
jgi:hypothetical protein